MSFTSAGPRIDTSRWKVGVLAAAPGAATVVSVSSTGSVARAFGPAFGSAPKVSSCAISAATPRRSQGTKVYSGSKLGLRDDLKVVGHAAGDQRRASLLRVGARDENAGLGR